jgi:hypothetical protein
MSEDNRWIITTCFREENVAVWQGHYGWSDVRPETPWYINRGHLYTEAAAKRALARLKRRHKHNLLWSNAKMFRLADLWTNEADPHDCHVKWHLLIGKEA